VGSLIYFIMKGVNLVTICLFVFLQISIFYTFAQSKESTDKGTFRDTSAMADAMSTNKKVTMFEDDNYLFAYLEKDIQDAKKDILAGKGISQRGAIAMLLKGLYNHISFLEEQMVTKDEFNREMLLIKNEFKSGIKELKLELYLLKSQFDFLKWLITFGFVFLAALQIILTFTKK